MKDIGVQSNQCKTKLITLIENAMLATDCEMSIISIEFTKTLVQKNFNKILFSKIEKGITSGMSGKYGRTHRLTPQEFCFWIYKYLDSQNTNKKGML